MAASIIAVVRTTPTTATACTVFFEGRYREGRRGQHGDHRPVRPRCPSAREYGGLLDNRPSAASRWPALLRPGPDRSAAARRLPGALERQVHKARSPRPTVTRCLSGRRRRQGPRIVCPEPITGEVQAFTVRMRLLCTGGYGNVFYLRPTRWAPTSLPQRVRQGRLRSTPATRADPP